MNAALEPIPGGVIDLVLRAGGCLQGIVEFPVPSLDADAVADACSRGLLAMVGNGSAGITPAGMALVSRQTGFSKDPIGAAGTVLAVRRLLAVRNLSAPLVLTDIERIEPSKTDVVRLIRQSSGVSSSGRVIAWSTTTHFADFDELLSPRKPPHRTKKSR